jgi:hypothetical protein
MRLHAWSTHTIGHSDQATAPFVDLLRQHGIAPVVDLGSQPYGRQPPQSKRETPEHDPEESGIAYRFMGDALDG